VLADHLKEAGDPRGEFITLQLQKPKGTLPASALRRERALLEVHESDWLGPLTHVVLPLSTGWERGFLSTAHARLHGETVGDPRWSTLTRLRLVAADRPRADRRLHDSSAAVCAAADVASVVRDQSGGGRADPQAGPAARPGGEVLAAGSDQLVNFAP